MQIIRYILRSINVLNIILLTATAFAVCYAVLPLFDMSIKVALPKAAEPVAEQAEKEEAYQMPPMSDFIIIGEQNIFHPERTIPIEKKADAIPRPEIILYGTMITKDMAIAYIEDIKNPYSTPGRGNRQRVLKKGEAISGFTLKQVGKDMILLERGEDKMTVFLKDKKNRNRSGAAPTRQITNSATPTTPPRPIIFPPSPIQNNTNPNVPVIVPPPRKR